MRQPKQSLGDDLKDLTLANFVGQRFIRIHALWSNINNKKIVSRCENLFQFYPPKIIITYVIITGVSIWDNIS